MRGKSDNEYGGQKLDFRPDAGVGLVVRGSVYSDEPVGWCPVPEAENEESTRIESSNVAKSSPEVAGFLISLRYHGAEPCTPLDLSPLRASQKHRQRAEPQISPPRTCLVCTKIWSAAALHEPDCMGH